MKEMTLLKQREKKKLHIIEWYLPLYLILVYYDYFGLLELGTIGLYIVTFIQILRNKRFNVNKSVLFFALYATLHNLIIALIVTDVPASYYNNMLQIIATVIVLATFNGTLDENKLFRAWSVVGVFVLLAVAYQSVLIYGFGQQIKPIILLPDLPSSNRIITEISSRPIAFFAEPGDISFFFAPLLYMLLKRNSLIFSALISIAVLLSGSTTGIIMLGFIWIALCVFQKDASKGKRNAGIIIFLALAAFFLLSDVLLTSRTKLENTDFKEVRLLYGIKLFIQAPSTYWSFGVPFTGVSEYLNANYGNFSPDVIEIIRKYTSSNGELFGYTNAFAYYLIIYGVVGTALALNIYRAVYKVIPRDYKVLLIWFLIMIFAQSVTFGGACFLCQFIILLGLSNTSDTIRLTA